MLTSRAGGDKWRNNSIFVAMFHRVAAWRTTCSWCLQSGLRTRCFSCRHTQRSTVCKSFHRNRPSSRPTVGDQCRKPEGIFQQRSDDCVVVIRRLKIAISRPGTSELREQANSFRCHSNAHIRCFSARQYEYE